MAQKGAAELIFRGRREQNAAFPPCAEARVASSFSQSGDSYVFGLCALSQANDFFAREREN